METLHVSLEIMLVLGLVAANGFFVAAEFALVKIRASQLRPMAKTGGWRVRMALFATSHLDAVLSSTQLGITLTSLGLGWIGEPVIGRRIEPLLGGSRAVLSEADWSAVQVRLAPYGAWLAAKPATRVEKIGATRARAILASGARGRLDALIERDLSAAPHFAALSSVEKLARLHRDFRSLLCNFVNFADFYSRDRWAVFQAVCQSWRWLNGPVERVRYFCADAKAKKFLTKAIPRCRLDATCT